jgi:hypothetical protein
VTADTGQVCGELIAVTQHQVVLRANKVTTLLPLSAVITIAPVTVCD